MSSVGVTELRQALPAWIDRVRRGEVVELTVRGVVVARLVPAEEPGAEARRALEALRSRAVIGDVESPIGDPWEAAT